LTTLDIINVANEGVPTGADEFLPLLIYVVLKTNPPHLHSNIKFISQFRNPNKLLEETGYYLTQLEAAVSFLEIVDASRLTIDPEEFEKNMNQKRVIQHHRRTPSNVSLDEDVEEPTQGFENGQIKKSDSELKMQSLNGDNPLYRFMNVDVKDLTIGHIYQLFDAYKALVEENSFLRAQLCNKSNTDEKVPFANCSE